MRPAMSDVPRSKEPHVIAASPDYPIEFIDALQLCCASRKQQVRGKSAALQVPFQNNATCNRTCVYKVVDNAYFNLEDSYIARARPAYVTTSEDLVKVVTVSDCTSPS